MSDTTIGFDDDFSFEKKSNRPRKSTAGARKIQYAWENKQIVDLIAAVEQHRGLWDISSPDYKLSKRDGWESVVKQLGIDGVDIKEAKTKWASLRTTFMVNLSHARKRQKRQGAADNYPVNWKYYAAMMFLEGNNSKNQTSSTSTIKLEIDPDFVCPLPSQPTAGSRKRTCNRQLAPSPTPSSSSSASALEILNNAVSVLKSADVNSTFCDYLLAELKTLPQDKARVLRNKIGRLVIDYSEEAHSEEMEDAILG